MGSALDETPRGPLWGALEQARKYVAQEGREFVVDLDLEKFFDRVNHDILMSRIARRIGDKRLLLIIRRFLQAGMIAGGGVRGPRRGYASGWSALPFIGQSSEASVARPWSFYIFSCDGGSDELSYRDFDLEFFQEFGVFGHFLT